MDSPMPRTRQDLFQRPRLQTSFKRHWSAIGQATDQDPAPLGIAFALRLGGVEQIQDDLLELDRVAGNHGKSHVEWSPGWRELRPENAVTPSQRRS